MTRVVRVHLACAAALLAPPASRGDDVIGAVWQVERKDGFKWRFRAGPKGVLWTPPTEGKPEPIGTWSGNPKTTVLKFDGKVPQKIDSKRTITIVLVGKNPSKWQGEVELPSGEKHPLTVTLIRA